MRIPIITALLLVSLSGCQKAKPTDSTQPNAVRDLLIDRIRWAPRAADDQPGLLLNQHQFSVTNTSTRHTYRQIRIRFDYYDAQLHRIGSQRYTIPQSVEARSALAIPPVRVGRALAQTRSATVIVEQAQSD